jgi:hypothetical protein
MAKKIKTGRKKIPDREKMVLVGFYIKNKVIESFGGINEVRVQAKGHIESIARESGVIFY